jgi:outer membrane protein OmpA-like peptidoglycan-associated protein
MKTRSWIAPLLAVALVIPAAAQQDSQPNPSPDSTQPAATAPQDAAVVHPTPSNEQLSPRKPLEVQRHEGFWGKLNPFARKKYVQRQVTPIADRTNELDELTAENARMIRDVDARAQEGIRLANAKAGEADAHALAASEQAQAAHQTAFQTSNRLDSLQQVVTNLDQYRPVTEMEIRFRPGQSALSQRAKAALDQMAHPLKDQTGYVVQVQGFSSGHGPQAMENSRHMAEAVARYLVINHDVPVYRVHMLGLGNTPMPAANGEKPRRVRSRVEVTLLKNDLEQLASSQPLAATGSSSPAATPNPNATRPASSQRPAPREPNPQDVPQQP